MIVETDGVSCCRSGDWRVLGGGVGGKAVTDGLYPHVYRDRSAQFCGYVQDHESTGYLPNVAIA